MYCEKQAAFLGALLLLALFCLAQDGPSSRGNRRSSWTSRALRSIGDPALATTPQAPAPGADPNQVKSFPVYTTADILRTSRLFVTKGLPLGQGRPAILVFDGELFHTFYPPGDDGSNSYIKRLEHAPSLLEDALRTHFPERFQPGQAPFQLLMSATDSPHTECLLHPQAPGEAAPIPGGDGKEGCDTAHFPPILQFGSVPKLDVLLPNMIAMPLPTFLPCLTEWRREKFGEDGAGAPSRSDPDSCRYRLSHLSHHTQTGEPYSTHTNSLSWELLKPTIVWRGGDHQFLGDFQHRLLRGNEMLSLGVLPDDLSDGKALVQMFLDRWDMLIPRWRAVALSLGAKMGAQVGYDEVSKMEGLGRADSLRCDDGCRIVRSIRSGGGGKEVDEAPWIDVKFFAASDERFGGFTSLGLDVVTDQYMDKDELASYRYHIDLGGGGGTTWEGTLTKLALPGLLFHHETLTKDDFHDRMVPWKHYVPVKMDLSDLKDRFDWAEAHPDTAQEISRAGTELAKEMASEEYLAELWDLNFRRRLDEVIKAYLPGEDETMESILESYSGLEFFKGHF